MGSGMAPGRLSDCDYPLKHGITWKPALSWLASSNKTVQPWSLEVITRGSFRLSSFASSLGMGDISWSPIFQLEHLEVDGIETSGLISVHNIHFLRDVLLMMWLSFAGPGQWNSFNARLAAEIKIKTKIT